jgi:D-alanyl-D-alanine carboxypeptidase/D-alanyl-D-alanine-endopeptidase (penicillin-binding protein 4)
LLSVIVVILAGCSAAPLGTTYYDLEDLQEKIDEQFSDTLFAHAHWGVMVQSLNSGKVWYKRNEERMFMPASNEKILTSAAALLKLGPQFKFTTTLNYTGEIIDSVLNGDLIIVGDGDPTLYNKFYDEPTTLFKHWADTLMQLGIKQINGNIIGDDNAFDDNHLGYGWAFDGLDAWYSAEVGALQLNENYLDLKFYPPLTASDTLLIVPNLISDYYSIENNVEVVDTGRSRIRIERPFGENKIIINGKIVVGEEPFERTPSLTNPTMFYVTVLKETFKQNGLDITGTPLDCDNIENYNFDSLKTKTILVHKSPPLNEILKLLMKRSQNMYAETMVRTLGYKYEGLGSFKNGKKIVEETLSRFGVEPGGYAFMDGSGLSRYNFVSPKQIIKILTGMWNGEYKEIWYDIQPVAGVDGTLKRRMKGTKAEGNVHAKTGTISNVRGLSGYVKTSTGEDVVFSFLINGHLKTSRDTELITDKVLEFIAEYPYISDDLIIDKRKPADKL